MIVKDILPPFPITEIEVRTNAPPDSGQEDMLFGYCRWDGEHLISIDNDTYYLQEKVTKYHFYHDQGTPKLVYWIESVWYT